MKEVVHAVMQEFSKAQASIIDWMKSGKAHKDIKPNIHLIELKGTVPNSEDWPDEIHPNASSNKRLAAKFKQSIDKKLRD